MPTAKPLVADLVAGQTPHTGSEPEVAGGSRINPPLISKSSPSKKLTEFIRVTSKKRAEATYPESQLKSIEDSDSRTTISTTTKRLRSRQYQLASQVDRELLSKEKDQEKNIYNIYNTLTPAHAIHGSTEYGKEIDIGETDPGIQDKPSGRIPIKRTPVPKGRVRHAPQEKQEAPQRATDLEQAGTAPPVLQAAPGGAGEAESYAPKAPREQEHLQQLQRDRESPRKALRQVLGDRHISGLGSGAGCDGSPRVTAGQKGRDGSPRVTAADHERSDSSCGFGPCEDSSSGRTSSSNETPQHSSGNIRADRPRGVGKDQKSDPQKGSSLGGCNPGKGTNRGQAGRNGEICDPAQRVGRLRHPSPKRSSGPQRTQPDDFHRSEPRRTQSDCEAPQGSSQAGGDMVGATRGACANGVRKASATPCNVGLSVGDVPDEPSISNRKIGTRRSRRDRSGGGGSVRSPEANGGGIPGCGGYPDGSQDQNSDHQDSRHARTQRGDLSPACESPADGIRCESPESGVDSRQLVATKGSASESKLQDRKGQGASGAGFSREHEPPFRTSHISHHTSGCESSGRASDLPLQGNGDSDSKSRSGSGDRSKQTGADQCNSEMEGPNPVQHPGQRAGRTAASRSHSQPQSRGAGGRGTKGGKASHRTRAELLEAAKELAQARARGESVPVPETEEQQKVRDMAYAYEEALAAYRHEPGLCYLKGSPTKIKTSYQIFKRATDIADQCKADYASYVQAQFYWFDKWFKRAPRTWELAGKTTKFPAPNRYLEYLKIKSSQHVPEKIQSISRRAHISPEKLDKINDMRLAELQRSWGIDEEQAFIRFARPGIGYFDAAWLRKHPTYRRLRQEKKL